MKYHKTETNEMDRSVSRHFAQGPNSKEQGGTKCQERVRRGTCSRALWRNWQEHFPRNELCGAFIKYTCKLSIPQLVVFPGTITLWTPGKEADTAMRCKVEFTTV